MQRTKTCEFCDKEFTPSSGNFARNRFCSRSCAAKRGNSGNFKAGDKKRLGIKHTDDSKRKMSISHTQNPTKYWLGKKRSDEVRKKMSEALRGEKSFLWRGGLSSVNQLIRSGLAIRIWREEVLKRDNYTCQECLTQSIPGAFVLMHADHIKPFAYFPDLRFEVTNGRTLCVPCHEKTATYLFGARKIYEFNK